MIEEIEEIRVASRDGLREAAITQAVALGYDGRRSKLVVTLKERGVRDGPWGVIGHALYRPSGEPWAYDMLSWFPQLEGRRFPFTTLTKQNRSQVQRWLRALLKP